MPHTGRGWEIDKESVTTFVTIFAAGDAVSPFKEPDATARHVLTGTLAQSAIRRPTVIGPAPPTPPARLESPNPSAAPLP